MKLDLLVPNIEWYINGSNLLPFLKIVIYLVSENVFVIFEIYLYLIT